MAIDDLLADKQSAIQAVVYYLNQTALKIAVRCLNVLKEKP
jgi:hypothetical protein